MNSILNLVRKKSRPTEVRGLSCLSLFSIGIKVSNAVQESVILALTVAQTSLSIWSRSNFLWSQYTVLFLSKVRKGIITLKKWNLSFIVLEKESCRAEWTIFTQWYALVYSISWDVRFNDKHAPVINKIKRSNLQIKIQISTWAHSFCTAVRLCRDLYFNQIAIEVSVEKFILVIFSTTYIYFKTAFP